MGAAAAGSSLGPFRACGMTGPVRPVPNHGTESDFVTVILNSCCKKVCSCFYVRRKLSTIQAGSGLRDKLEADAHRPQHLNQGNPQQVRHDRHITNMRTSTTISLVVVVVVFVVVVVVIVAGGGGGGEVAVVAVAVAVGVVVVVFVVVVVVAVVVAAAAAAAAVVVVVVVAAAAAAAAAL